MSEEGPGENDIAIVGMALRVPGASSPTEFWQNLREGRESIVDYDEETMLASGESKEALRNPAYVRRGGALRDMKLFDRDFFGFGPKEAAILDPQHRHFMELCWEALEDGGHTPKRFDGRIGLFGGCGMGSYFYFNVCSNRDLVDSVGLFLLRHTGNDKDFLATRVSYVLDLKGPSINVQTACSTSLVATHLACQSLLTGESDLALAGGVTILFPTEAGYVFRDGEVLSPDGHCHAFDHRAQGTILSSGGGVVALRRLEDALADGDEIYAIIKGSAVNNDGGQKVGYLAPSVDGQAAAMTEAYSLADLDPTSIGFIECHGTGTYMGDPIEIAALTQAFRASDPDKSAGNQFCRIGSVKTNIGHLDTAAGVVGLMKAALALKHGEMPPSLNYDRPNPEIGFEHTPFVVNDTLRAWPAGREPRRAAVNSLGVGGTNAHVVLEESVDSAVSTPSERPFTLLQISARAKKSLDGACERLASHLEDHPELDLADVAFSLQTSREELERRRILVAKDRGEAIELLKGLDPRRVFTHSVTEGRASLVFMFSGGGSQYPNMGRDLYDSEPVFREHVDRGFSLYQQRTGVDLRPLVYCDESELPRFEPQLAETQCQLPAIFIFEYAMVQLLADKGLEPDLLIGHSMGENAAACVAGVISYQACLDWVILRGQLTAKTPLGGMISVSLPADDLVAYLGDACDLAAANAPGLSVASGSAAEIDALQKRLEDAEIDFQRIQVDRAGHSRLFDPILSEFRTFIESLDLQAPKIPMISNRTGQFLTDEQATDPDYWVEHLRESVRFATGLATVLETPGRVLVEVGPGQALCSFARQQPAQGALANIIPSYRHRADASSDAAYFLATLGRLWASGVDLDLSRLYEGETRRRVRLPTYAWDHQSYFIDRVEASAAPSDSNLPEYVEDVTDWGFVPTWQPAPIDPRRLESAQTWLIFMDRAGLGRRLRKRLEAQGHRVVSVFEADNYRKRSEFEYSLAPELGREGYDALIKDLAAAGHMPSQVVHLWLATDAERFRPGSSFFHENLQNGFYSLYFLARAMADENLPGEVHLTVVSTGMQKVLADDDSLYPEKATALGPIEVVPRELPGVTCKSIDVAWPESGGSFLRQKLLGRRATTAGRPESLDRIVDQLEAEILAPAESDIVAHRGNDRYVRRFEPGPLRARRVEAASPLVDRGVYLITGGLGGLGLTLADRLAREVPGIRLVLVGRGAMPARDRWDDLLATPGTPDQQIRRIRQIRALEATGAEVMTLAADVTNLDEMRRGVSAVRERFGPIDGIFHAAGVVSDDLIQMKADADIERVFGPKVHGTLVLDSLLEEAGAKLLVLYSSTSAITAPPGQVDYVAANSFLDAFAQSRRGHPVRTISINWGIWNEVGLAATTLLVDDGAKDAVESGPVSHPFFDSRSRDSHGRTGFQKSFSPQRDWILEEHRTSAGEALFPGAGYPELARAALAEYGETGPFHMQDLYFLRPLYVPDGEVRDVRVQLKPTDRGYHFSVRTRHRVDGRPAWVLAAEAALELGGRDEAETIDLAAIDERCRVKRSSVNPLGHASGQENHVRFGPRWRVLRQVLYGDGEALARLEVPDAFVGDLADYQVHPALLDYATGYAMELIEGYDPEEALWIPVSYGRISVHAPLEKKVSSWVRLRKSADGGADFASFDVVIASQDGRVLFEAEDFTIKRVLGRVDVAAPVDTKTSDIEFEASASLTGDEDLSPAELQLRRNYEAGIRPEDGTEALLRVLADDLGAQVAVTSIDLEFLQRQAERVVADSSSSGARFERPDLDSQYREPRDEIEKTLVALWEELLGVEGLGIGDSFFDLGGHSLIAVRLFSKIKKTYRVEFPISVLFEAPTIEGCADLIREAIGADAGSGDRKEAPARRPRFKHLVAMDGGGGDRGGRPPFFLVAGMFGNVLNLRHLASLVGTDRPFYGLQARGLYGDESPHETFEEMAAAYLEEIRSVQPRGPYSIGGFSGGGITAFEMAHQLRDAGEEVSMLLMLDSILPTEDPLSRLDRLRVQWIRVRKLGPRYLLEWARKRAKWQMEQLEARFGSNSEPELAMDEFHNVAIERAFRSALPRYQMRRYEGPVHLFRPKLDRAYVLGPDRVLNSEKRWIQPDNAWGPWVGSIDVVEMPGDHDSMVLEPNVRVMATKLRELLDRSERDSTVENGADSD